MGKNYLNSEVKWVENIPKEFRSLRIGYNKLMKDFKH